jgi:hypothetical protein
MKAILRAARSMFSGAYLVPICFHIYVATSSLIALKVATNMPQASSFASRKRVWRHGMQGKVAELQCGMMPLGGAGTKLRNAAFGSHV